MLFLFSCLDQYPAIPPSPTPPKAPPVSSEAKLSYAAPSAQTSALEQVVVDGLVGNEVNLNENITYDDSVRSKPATRTVNNVAFATSTTAFGSHQFPNGFGDSIDSTTRTAVSHAGNTSPSAVGEGTDDADESGADTESSKTDLGGTQKKPTASSSSMDASQRESNIKWLVRFSLLWFPFRADTYNTDGPISVLSRLCSTF